jgi:uncharacterized membrane protein YebE (DUF533 family)
MPDRAERLRTRSIGVRVTEADFARLHALAEAQGKVLGEWARDALLALAQHPAGTAVEQTLLAEAVALRTVVAKLIFAFTSDGRVTYMERADKVKLKRAIEILERLRAGAPAPPSAASAGGASP